MRNFKAGASGPAHDGACADGLGSASDLVQRTLARHGLWPRADADNAPLHGLMSGMNGGSPLPQWHSPSPGISVPAGAVFRSGSHTGRTGSRAYRHYVPATAAEGVAGIVMMLHGCTQTPEDFAVGTRMNALAERHRLVVLYPEQSRGANAQTCWNWFSRGDQRRGRGEPEILAGIAQTARAEHGVSPERVFVAGLSAGAAMAVILGETYPDIFAAVGAHSGLPYGAAHDLPSAYAAMAGNAPAAAALATKAPRTIVFHGTADRTVHPANGEEIARRAAPRTQIMETTEAGVRGGRGIRRTVGSDANGKILSEHWEIEGLGHAWSGGNGAGSYADPSGPDASAEMVRFFLDLPVEERR